MIFDLILILFFQPLLTFIFFLLAPLVDDFFKNKIDRLSLKVIIYSFLSDLVFLKPLGFFLFISSFSILILTILEKFIPPRLFYQKFFFLFIFNLFFLFLFFFLSFKQLSFFLFFKILFLNLLFQIIYLIIKTFVFK